MKQNKTKERQAKQGKPFFIVNFTPQHTTPKNARRTHESNRAEQLAEPSPKHAQNSPKTHENSTPTTKAKQQQQKHRQNTSRTPKQPSPQAERQSTQTGGQGGGQVVDFAK